MKLEQAVRHFGTQKAIAETLGISDQAVSYWKSRDGGIVPFRQALILERKSRGKLKLRLGDYR